MLRPQRDYKLQALLPPQDILLKTSRIIHGHIIPSFGRAVKNNAETSLKLDKPNFIDITQAKSFSSTDYSNSWAKDIPCAIQTSPDSDEITQVSLRIVVDSNMNCPFPQSHRVMISCPLDDIFFHWTYLCTPFSYKSLVKRMDWTMAQTAGDAVDSSFRNFGHVLMSCAIQSARYPDTMKVKLILDRENSVAQLAFTEVVQSYRKIQLLVLDFVPSEYFTI